MSDTAARASEHRFFITESSPLRRPPTAFSRRQVMFLDGIRYAAEMAYIAYDRLFEQLMAVTRSPQTPQVRDIAAAMLDAWSIVDAAHRFGDLIEGLPGLPRAPWKRLLQDRTEVVATLRNNVQHQRHDLREPPGSGAWGYLSWAELHNGRHTGKWLMMSAGSYYVGEQWLFIGPIALPCPVPGARIRLNAFGQRVYLGRTVVAIAEAIGMLEKDIVSGTMRPRDTPATERRGADVVYEGYIEIISSNTRLDAYSGPN